MLQRLILMTLLVALLPNLSYSAEVTHVPAGWTTPSQGYFLEEQAGRDVLAALQSRRRTSEQWEAAYSDLRTEFLTTTDTLKEQIKAIEDNINDERKAWRAEVNRARWGWVLPALVAGGLGYAVGR